MILQTNMPVWTWAKKEEYFVRVEELLGSYSKIFVVGVSIMLLVSYYFNMRSCWSEGSLLLPFS